MPSSVHPFERQPVGPAGAGDRPKFTLESRADAHIAPLTTAAPAESEVEPGPLDTTSPIRNVPPFLRHSEHGPERGLVQMTVLYQRFTEGGVRDSHQSDPRSSWMRSRIAMDGMTPSVSMPGTYDMSELEALDAKREVWAGTVPSVRFL
jgi:hypothetical protein